MPYDGQMTGFDYYRLCHIDTLPGPEWDYSRLKSIEEMGAFFDRRAGDYEAHVNRIGFDKETYQRAAMPLPQTGEALNILDLGCGTGLELQYVFERMPNARVTCMDLSEEMLGILAKNYKDKFSLLIVIRDSYLTRDYPEAEYDAVISVNTMHHLLPEPKTQLYRKINRSLKPGGWYVESDFMVDQAMMAQYQARYQRVIRDLPVRQYGYYHIDIPLTVAVQKELLLKAGFGGVEVFYENIKPKGSGAVLVARKGAS